MMKKLLFLGVLSFWVLRSVAQDASVERTLFGAEAGLLGFWVYNETKLAKPIALHSEIGFNGGFGYVSGDNQDLKYFFANEISLEPRWYYNLQKRLDKNKPIFGNSGNFATVKISYAPDWVLITNAENVKIISSMTFIPMWGMRRNINGSHFNYELGGGIGYRLILNHDYYSWVQNDNAVAININARIGYWF